MSNRTTRWIAIALGALLALLVVCVVLLRLLFDPNDYRTTIEAAFNERTGRVLRLEGELGLRLFPRLAVRTGPFSISDRPGAREGDFLTAQDARLGLKLLPLLQRRVELGELKLVKPVVALRVDAQGRDNWSDLMQRPAPPEPLDKSGREPVTEAAVTAFRIEGLGTSDGRLTYEDVRRSRRIEFTDLELDAGPLAVDSATQIRTSFALVRKNRAPLRSDLRGRIARARPGMWTVEDLAINFELPAAPDGRREPVRGRVESARATADLDARRYSVPELRYRLGDAEGEASLEARQGRSGLVVEGPVSLERAELRPLLAALDVALPKFKDPDVPGEIGLKATLHSGSGVALRNLVATLGETRLTGSVELGSGAGSPVRFDLRCDRLALDDYLPAAAGKPVAAAEPVATANERMNALDVRGRLTFGRVTFAGNEFSDLDANIALQGGTLEIDPLRASVFGGTSQTKLRYQLTQSVPRLALEQRLTNVDTAALLTQLFNQRRISGRGSLATQLTGAGRGRPALLASLAGPFETRVLDGRLTGIDLWAEIERAVATAQGKAAAPRSASAYTPFDRFLAEGRLDGTLIRSDRIEVENASMSARGKGTVNYGTGALDLELTARLLDAPEGTVAGLSLDRIVGVDIPLTIRGSLSDPRVRPDVDRLLESAARQKLKEEGKEIEKKLKEKLGETLKDLIGQ